MPADESRERPPIRLPYIRIEGAGGAIVWMLGVFIAGVPVFLVMHMLPVLRPYAKAFAGIAGLALVVLFLDYWKFEERVDIDDRTVRHRRKSLLGDQEWSERLANYKGVALLTAGKDAAEAQAAGPSHWSRRKPERIIQLVHPNRERSVTLYELDARDFREEVGRKLTQFSSVLNVEILTRIEQ